MSVGLTRSPSLTTNFAICLTLMTYLLFSESFSSCIILVHRATWRGWSSDIRCRSAAMSHRCGGARPVSDSYKASARDRRKRGKALVPWHLQDVLATASISVNATDIRNTNQFSRWRWFVSLLFVSPAASDQLRMVQRHMSSILVCPWQPWSQRRSTCQNLSHGLSVTYSSVSGMIFFSGSSSSANSFLYFSQLCPVALGMMGLAPDDEGSFEESKKARVGRFSDYRDVVRPVSWV